MFLRFDDLVGVSYVCVRRSLKSPTKGEVFEGFSPPGVRSGLRHLLRHSSDADRPRRSIKMLHGARTMFAAGFRVRGPLLAASAIGGGTVLAAVNSSPAECAFFSSKPKVHLRYFKIGGVAETIRHLMALGNLDWTEDAWSIDFSKFGKGGPNPALVAIASPGFAAAKTAGELDANMERAPVILVDGKHEIGQSKTIERYLARRLGLLGSGEIEAAQIDAITEHVRDIKDKYQKAKADPAEKAKYFDEVMPEFMSKLDKAIGVMGGKGSGPLVGNSLSLADVTLLVFILDFFDDKEKAKASVASCPRLLASLKATAEHPGVAKYRAKRDAN